MANGTLGNLSMKENMALGTRVHTFLLFVRIKNTPEGVTKSCV